MVRVSSLFVHFAHLVLLWDLALPPDLGVSGLKIVCCGQGAQDKRCYPRDCPSQRGHEVPVGCAQWSAAVVCLCPGLHGLSSGKDI